MSASYICGSGGGRLLTYNRYAVNRLLVIVCEQESITNSNGLLIDVRLSFIITNCEIS